MLINYIEVAINETVSFKENKYKSNIVVGSTNVLKIQAVKNAAGHDGVNVFGYSASSNVRTQPLSEEETRQGAVNRAKDSLNKTQAELGIGLEAGIFFLNDLIYLCHWGALVDRNENVYITNGPIINTRSLRYDSKELCQEATISKMETVQRESST